MTGDGPTLQNLCHLRLMALSLLLASALIPMSVGEALAAHAGEAEGEEAESAEVLGPWHARVAGVGPLGLHVREGPGTWYRVVATLQDGSRLEVMDGPELDPDGREWYLVSGYDRASGSGWSVGEFLREVDPNEPATLGSAGSVPVAGARTFTARITGYAHGTRTATGTPVRWGVVAVDPRVIPLGSRLLIDGLDGVFIAEDTGGGVRGNHIDIYFPDRASAIRWGVQHRTVTVLP